MISLIALCAYRGQRKRVGGSTFQNFRLFPQSGSGGGSLFNGTVWTSCRGYCQANSMSAGRSIITSASHGFNSYRLSKSVCAPRRSSLRTEGGIVYPATRFISGFKGVGCSYWTYRPYATSTSSHVEGSITQESIAFGEDTTAEEREHEVEDGEGDLNQSVTIDEGNFSVRYIYQSEGEIKVACRTHPDPDRPVQDSQPLSKD